MKKVALGARLLLGLIFVVFGLNGFLQFLPAPPLPEPAMQFIGALIQSGYLFTLVKALEIIAGLMLLTGFQVPLAQLLLAPIVVNIFLFHFVFTGPLSALANIPMILVALMIVVAWDRKSNYQPLFK